MPKSTRTIQPMSEWEQAQYNRWMVRIRIDGNLAIRCGECGMTSYNPNDIEKGYCGNCHKFFPVRTHEAEICDQCNAMIYPGRMHRCTDHMDVDLRECIRCKRTFSRDKDSPYCEECDDPMARRFEVLEETGPEDPFFECERCGKIYVTEEHTKCPHCGGPSMSRKLGLLMEDEETT